MNKSEGSCGQEIQGMIAELRKQYNLVQQKQEFLKLKESELRPEDEISFFGFLEAKQNLAIEQSLLSGHALMVQEDIQKKRLELSSDDQTFLKEIVAYSRRLPLL